METLKTHFTNLWENAKMYLSFDIKCNSENKQINLFIVAINLLSEGLKEEEKKTKISKDNNLPLNKEKFISKAFEVIFSIFKDFCLHLNIYSKHVMKII